MLGNEEPHNLTAEGTPPEPPLPPTPRPGTPLSTREEAGARPPEPEDRTCTHLPFWSWSTLSLKDSSSWSRYGVISTGSSTTVSLIGWKRNSLFFPGGRNSRKQSFAQTPATGTAPHAGRAGAPQRRSLHVGTPRLRSKQGQGSVPWSPV